ncbi:hypothetical protein ACFE04_028902 [Oxalis oulophora]
MGRHSCCVKQKLRKGLWSPEEDEKLYDYITKFGVGCWSSIPKLAGLLRCGKSCRLRWINYLRPDLKRGMFCQQEEDLILNLHQALGNRWAQIAAQLPGRTDNEIKNFWNSCLKKKLLKKGIDPMTHKPIVEVKQEDDIQISSPDNISSMQTQQSKPNISNFSAHELTFFVNDLDSYCDNRVQCLDKPVESTHLFYQSVFHTPILDSATNTNFQFAAMPSYEHGSISNTSTEYSDNSALQIGWFLANEAKESSSNNSSNNNTNRVNSENSTNFSWDPNFQFQVKSEDIIKFGSWQDEHVQSQNSVDFSSYPSSFLSDDLTATNFDHFQPI